MDDRRKAQEGIARVFRVSCSFRALYQQVLTVMCRGVGSGRSGWEKRHGGYDVGATRLGRALSVGGGPVRAGGRVSSGR